MNSDGVGQLQLLQLLETVFHHLSLVKFHGDQLREGIDVPYDACIPVEHAGSSVHRNPVPVSQLPLHLIIIFYLHHLVACAKRNSSRLLLLLVRRRRVQVLLQDSVQPLHPQGALSHRSHDLDIKHISLHIARQLVLHQGDHGADDG